MHNNSEIIQFFKGLNGHFGRGRNDARFHVNSIKCHKISRIN